MNSVNIMGRLTADPIQSNAGATTVAKFSIAVNRKYKDKEEVSFFTCEAWGKTGDAIHKYLKKGNRILLTGTLQQDRWEQDGNKREKTKIVVQAFYFVDKRGESDAAPADNPFSDDDIPF